MCWNYTLMLELYSELFEWSSFFFSFIFRHFIIAVTNWKQCVHLTLLLIELFGNYMSGEYTLTCLFVVL